MKAHPPTARVWRRQRRRLPLRTAHDAEQGNHWGNPLIRSAWTSRPGSKRGKTLGKEGLHAHQQRLAH